MVDNALAALASPQHPAVELRALPRPPNWSKGREREGKGGRQGKREMEGERGWKRGSEGIKEEREKEEGERGGNGMRGRNGKGRDVVTSCSH